MPRSQRNDNFIDKTFTVIADILLKVLPHQIEKKKLLVIIVMVCQLNQKVNMLKPFRIIMKH